MDLPRALVISNFPIIAFTAREVLGQRYEVVPCSWAAFLAQPTWLADVAIVDVTSMEKDTALKLLSGGLLDSRVVLCSMHHNEVQVYRLREDGLTVEAGLGSLLDLASDRERPLLLRH